MRENYQGDDNDTIGKWQYWGGYHWEAHQVEAHKRRMHHKDLYFD